MRKTVVRRLLAGLGSLDKATTLMLACIAVASACASDSSTSDAERHPENYRCRFTEADGTCTSMPDNCPVTLPLRPRRAVCPLGAELIPIDEDDCAHKLICID